MCVWTYVVLLHYISIDHLVTCYSIKSEYIFVMFQTRIVELNFIWFTSTLGSKVNLHILQLAHIILFTVQILVFTYFYLYLSLMYLIWF